MKILRYENFAVILYFAVFFWAKLHFVQF